VDCWWWRDGCWRSWPFCVSH